MADILDNSLAKKFPITLPPQKSPDGLVKVTFCNDPDGTPVELVEIIDSTIAKDDDKNE